MSRSLWFPVVCAVLVLGGQRCFRTAFAQDGQQSAKAPSEAVITALEEFNLLIGEWRGIGQPKRGSAQGAWKETSRCVWEITKKTTGIRWKAEDGKLWSSALIGYLPEKKEYTVQLELPDKSLREFTGNFEKQKLIAESGADKSGEVHRLTLSLLNENRVTALFEKRVKQQTFYNRVAEIGFQRQGTTLAASDGNGPECVVTGGKGTIAVTYNSKTYYVCCTGCRDAFQDDPAGILAAYAEKKKTKSKRSAR